MVAGEDEEGIDFQVETLFSCKRKHCVYRPIMSLGFNLDLLSNDFLFSFLELNSCNPWTPNEWILTWRNHSKNICQGN